MLTIIPVVILLTTVPQASTPRERSAASAESALPDAELLGMLDTYAIVRAQDALQIKDTQYGQFATRLRQLQQARRRNQQARHRLVQQLRRLAGQQARSSPDERSIREVLKALRDHDERSASEIRQAYDALDEVLDLRQRARFRIFEENMERRKLDLLVRARERVKRRN